VQDGFAETDVRMLRLFEEEMVGVDLLRVVASELYEDTDPTKRLSQGHAMRITSSDNDEDGDDVELVLSVPFAERGEVDLMRHGDEVFVTVGSYRRSVMLPDSLRRRTIRGAKIHEGELRVVFTLEDS
jgi:arsenite-transporting ATPase